MTSEQSFDIVFEAMDLWKTAGENPTEKQYQDVVSLITLAIKKESGPFPIAHSLIAKIHFDMGNFVAAWDAATNTLLLDPNDLYAQFIKMYVALGYTWEAMDTTETQGIMLNAFGKSVRFRSGYGTGNKFGSAVTQVRSIVARLFDVHGVGYKLGNPVFDRNNVENLKKITNTEFARLIAIYQHLANNGINASEFIPFSRGLIDLADSIYENPYKVIEEDVNIYKLVAHTPIEKLDFETEEEKEQLETIQLIAKGKML